MQKKVFISGPIQGMENRQGYREKIKRICIRCGYQPIDPWQREKVLYRGERPDLWRKASSLGFIKRDLEDIEKCDILIAYMPRLSAGTCMELFYAKMKGKQTICVCRLKNPSPWIIVHSDILVKRIEDLEEALNSLRS
jgi:nucleoside 2-deoxyribosyltransferase